MEAIQSIQKCSDVSSEKVVSFVNELLGIYPNPEDPDGDDGPLGPYVRRAIGKIRFPEPPPYPWHLIFARLRPEIWDVIGGGPLSWATLNPQPLPPRAALTAFLAQEIIDRALLIQETADIINRNGEQQGIIVSGHLQNLVDELCPPHKFPIPPPKKRNDDDGMLSALELLTASAVFNQNALTVANEELRGILQKVAEQLTEAALERM